MWLDMNSCLSTMWNLLVAVLFVVSLLGCSLYIWFYWTHRRLLRAVSNIPLVMPTWPLMGHSYIIFRGVSGMTKALLEMSSRTLESGIKTSVFWCGPLPVLAIHASEDIEMVLKSSSTVEKGDDYKFFSDLFNAESNQYHLIFAPNSVWRKTRRHTNPLFHPQNLEQMEHVFNHNSRLLVDCLAKHGRKEEFDINRHVMNISLLTVCNLMFGPEVIIDIKSRAFLNLVKFVETVPDLFTQRTIRPWLKINAVFRYLYRKELNELKALWAGFTEASLQVTKNYNGKRSLKEDNLTKRSAGYEMEGLNQEDVDGQMNIVDVYTELQKNHPEFGEKDLFVEVAGFYCTGSDTIGAGASACFLALAQYQDIQERLYQEISSVVKGDGDITVEDLNKMPYLDQVIKEALRCFMVVPFVLRKTSKDIKLSACTVPAGSTMIVALSAIHMNPEIHPEPKKFDPDRFSPDVSPEKEKFAYIPFSAGPRNCVAKVYALQLMKIMVVHVLKSFKLHTEMDIHKLNWRLAVTLVSADGYLVTLEKR